MNYKWQLKQVLNNSLHFKYFFSIVMHDIIIVGGGIAGLRVGIESLKRGVNCCILEKYDIGGRVETFKKVLPGGPVQWESGAGRICTMHKKVLALFKQYGLTFVPHSSESQYIDTENNPNTFNELIDVYIEPLKKLDPMILATHTLAQLFEKIGVLPFYIQFPYFSEIHVLRADRAIYTFSNEMGSSSFGSCKEGLSALIDGMREEFISLGGTVLGMDVFKIHKNTVFCKEKFNDKMNIKTFHAKKIVLAVHSNALKMIKGIHAPVLKYLTMQPLLRIYAVFSEPVNIPRIVTDSPIRYIIPISPRIVMISYTDGDDTRFWKDKGQEEVMVELRKIVDVPDPIFFKKHYWRDGCTYWLPGAYNVEEESEKSLQIADNVFVCGESYAVNQCWMESALEQADKLLRLLKKKVLI